MASRDMMMAFGSHLAISGEMEILALRDNKSSKVEFKGMQMGTQSVFHSSDRRERVREQRINGQIIAFCCERTERAKEIPKWHMRYLKTKL